MERKVREREVKEREEEREKEAAAKAEELALAQEILRVRQDWREPRGVTAA